MRRLLVALLLLAAAPVPAAELPALALPDLRDGERRDLRSLARGPALVVLFEPRCPWCVRQLRAVDRLTTACPEAIRAVGVGIHGDRPGYRRVLRAAEVELPAVGGSEGLVAAVGEVPATPWTLFVNEEDRVTHRLRGYVRLPDLLPWLAAQGVRCPPFTPGQEGDHPVP
ncbi:MAG: TlpA family protein disulfide reductase [Pseudomonadota bacterium]